MESEAGSKLERATSASAAPDEAGMDCLGAWLVQAGGVATEPVAVAETWTAGSSREEAGKVPEAETVDEAMVGIRVQGASGTGSVAEEEPSRGGASRGSFSKAQGAGT